MAYIPMWAHLLADKEWYAAHSVSLEMEERVRLATQIFHQVVEELGEVGITEDGKYFWCWDSDWRSIWYASVGAKPEELAVKLLHLKSWPTHFALWFHDSNATVVVEDGHYKIEIVKPTGWRTDSAPRLETIPRMWKEYYPIMPSLIGVVVWLEKFQRVVVNLGPYKWGAYGRAGEHPGKDSYGYRLLSQGRVETVYAEPIEMRFDSESTVRGIGDSSACLAESRQYLESEIRIYLPSEAV